MSTEKIDECLKEVVVEIDRRMELAYKRFRAQELQSVLYELIELRQFVMSVLVLNHINEIESWTGI